MVRWKTHHRRRRQSIMRWVAFMVAMKRLGHAMKGFKETMTEVARANSEAADVFRRLRVDTKQALLNPDKAVEDLMRG